jgi:hypothetical protein
MEEIFKHFEDADSTTLAIFDVDMVLIQPAEPAFQMANMKRHNSISKRIFREIPKEKQMIFLGLMTVGSPPVLINDCIPQYLQRLIQRGIPAMALTANLTGKLSSIENMEKWRVEALRLVGIDFSQSAPYHSPIIFDTLPSYRGNYSAFLEGILFVNGTNVQKGEALVSFLQKVGRNPKKVVFVDDREENLVSVGKALQSLDETIEYKGLHFLGAQNYPSKEISEDEFESRWVQLAEAIQDIN